MASQSKNVLVPALAAAGAVYDRAFPANEGIRSGGHRPRLQSAQTLFFQYRLVLGVLEFLLCFLSLDDVGKGADLNSKIRIPIVFRGREDKRLEAFLFHAPQPIKDQFPQFKAYETYADLLAAMKQAMAGASSCAMDAAS